MGRRTWENVPVHAQKVRILKPCRVSLYVIGPWIRPRRPTSDAAGSAMSTKSPIFQTAGGQDEQINRIDES